MWLTEKDFIGFILAIGIVGAIFGGIAFYAIPKLWELVKPWLHLITA